MSNSDDAHDTSSSIVLDVNKTPRITIDTAVDVHPVDHLSHNSYSPQPNLLGSPQSLRYEPKRYTAIDLASRSEDIYSPASSVTSENLLLLPTIRSRSSSIGSDILTIPPSTYAGSTYVPNTPVSPSSMELVKFDIRPSDILQSVSPELSKTQFGVSPAELDALTNPKSLVALHNQGGLKGLQQSLNTDIKSGLSIDGALGEDNSLPRDNGTKTKTTQQHKPALRGQFSTGYVGLSSDDFAHRRRIFGTNRLPERPIKSIWQLCWIAYKDKVLILLTIAAVISLSLGVYQSVTSPPGQPRVQWVEGVAIVVAILVVVIVGAVNDWQKERQFVNLDKKKDDRKVKAVRSGRSIEISVYDVLVGDVLHLEPGDIVPVDGVFIEGHGIKCDESSVTGESELLAKTPALNIETGNGGKLSESDTNADPFIISGAKVVDGIGTFLVTATGTNSIYGRTLTSLREDAQTTPLQEKLDNLAVYISKFGLAAGLVMFVVLFIRFLVNLKGMQGAEEKGQAFLQIFIVSVTIIVVAVPEGLPLAVTLALAFATKRMLKDNNLVRFLKACEVMGNATTICSDKTGTLTENEMTVVAATISSAISGDGAEFDGQTPSPPDFSDPALSTAVKMLHPSIKQVLCASIALNSTAIEENGHDGVNFIGSSTEAALLRFARDWLGLGTISEERANGNIVDIMPFRSDRKFMAVVVKLGKTYRMYIKGASETILSASTCLIDSQSNEVAVREDARRHIDSVITSYASRSLRTIGLAYRDLEQWPPSEDHAGDTGEAAFLDIASNELTLVGIFGIQDPLRPGVTNSVRECQEAGVFVRMVTGDNLKTAQAIGRDCGLYTSDGIAMEGPDFRKLDAGQMGQVLPKLQILARASPEDKKILVTQLQKLGEIVAVTGDGTNDAPALKAADVGFSMGKSGTEVAKEASDIVLLDDNFSSLVRAISWGRTVNDAVKKFLQFQITVNITAVMLTLISAAANNHETSVLTAVQLLWVNLIMDTFAALALATDRPSPHVLQRKPEPRTSPLISATMWKMIIGQSLYQLCVTLVLNFAGRSIFKYVTPEESNKLQTLVFNTFVWTQVFNQLNCRRVDNRLNIFEGVHRNIWFIAIQLIIIAGQVMIMFVGGQAFSIHQLNGVEWAVSLGLGALSLPIALAIRLVPVESFLRLREATFHRKASIC